MMYAKEILALLDQKGIEYEAVSHVPVFTIEEMDDAGIPHSELIAKNLFLRDDKKHNYYLVTLPGHKRADIKAIAAAIPSRKLTFADEEALAGLLGLGKGHVSPFGILNNEERNVVMVFDGELSGTVIGIHPNENTSTVFVKYEDVKGLIEEHGNRVTVI